MGFTNNGKNARPIEVTPASPLQCLSRMSRFFGTLQITKFSMKIISANDLVYFFLLRKYNRFLMWNIDMMSIRNPSFPWIPPSGEWVLITIHLTAVAIPVINVIIVIHHNISVARLLRFLNLVHQLLLPKCKYRWIQTSVINNNPISIWIHTDKYPLLWATSSWIPESNTVAKAITRLQLQSFNLVTFFILFQGRKHSVWACSDTFIASYASVGIDYANVLVER